MQSSSALYLCPCFSSGLGRVDREEILEGTGRKISEPSFTTTAKSLKSDFKATVLHLRNPTTHFLNLVSLAIQALQQDLLMTFLLRVSWFFCI